MTPPENLSPAFDKNRGLKAFFAFAKGWADCYQLLWACLILLLGAAPFISVVGDPPDFDAARYHTLASGIKQGVLPYRDLVLEYPPYAMAIFLLPKLLGEANYSICFKLLVIVADTIIKCLLLAVGLREAKGIRSLLPLASYSIALPFMRFFFLQRYDAFPAVVSVAALWLFCSRKYALSGLMIALGAGIKLYPALFALPLFVLAWRERKGKHFLFGLIGGGMPILLLGLLLPWWRFLAFNAQRGLQAESLYASGLWLAHHSGLGEAKWESANGCMEVHGALADTVLPWSRAGFMLAVGISTVLSCWAAARSRQQSAPHLARLLLLPLVAFVIFNQVFSPQYMIWLLPFAAMASVVGNPWIAMAVPLATMLIPIFYPSPEYVEGLNLFETLVLVARNLILLGVWVLLARELLLLVREEGRPDRLKP